MPQSSSRKRPLAGIRVVDFSNLLPGPYATQILHEAGAEVLKIERPDGGDELRAGAPRWGDTSLSFALLNSGKRSIALDLKTAAERERLLPLLQEADVLVEQFRPGVMDRLGLGYETVKAINPGIIYCSITGYGQAGPLSQVAGHDLNYMAETGILSLSRGADGSPVLPPVLVGDIGGGTMPAVINILLALRHRDQTGEGCHLDVSITDNLFAFPYHAVSRGVAYGQWPKAGAERLTGGSPRYQIYRTSDDRHIAAAPLEQRFWNVFCGVIGLEPALRDDTKNPEATRKAVADLIARQDSAYWRRAFEGKDACAVIVSTMEEAASHPHFTGRGLLGRRISTDSLDGPALRVPLDRQFLRDNANEPCPALGEGNGLLGK